MKQLLILVGCLMATLGRAQPYAIDWYKIAGGGGTSTAGTYSVSGAIGQPDASGLMNGGQYSLIGGFWSLVSAVQTAGTPDLIIVGNGSGGVEVLWPNTGAYTLMQNIDLDNAAGWTASSYTITTTNGTSHITVTPRTGSLFFRLANP